MVKKHVKMTVPVLFAFLLVWGAVSASVADVRVNINLGPPPIAVAAPPEVVAVPGSSVYFVPGVDFDVFFYNGYWWSPRGDRWYRARAYNGPWNTVPRGVVPAPVYRVPHDYRRVYMHERHIPYGQWKKEHRGYERHGGGRGEGHGHGEGRGGGYGHGEGRGGGHGHGEGRGHGEGHGHGRD